MQEVTQIFIYVLGVPLAALSISIIAGVASFIKNTKTRADAENFRVLKSVALQIVRWVEQSIQTANLAGTEKKKIAIVEIRKFCFDNFGFEPPYEMIDKAIEEAVFVMNETIAGIEVAVAEG